MGKRSKLRYIFIGKRSKFTLNYYLCAIKPIETCYIGKLLNI